MFKKINWRTTVRTSVIAAVLFCIPVFFYIHFGDYTGSWLLYLGNFLFLVVLWLHTMAENKKRSKNESILTLVFSGHLTTLAGILLSCVLCFILLVLFVPGYLAPGIAEKTLTSSPPQVAIGRTNGLSFEIFMAATVVNFSVGSFSSILLPFYTNRDQTKDRRQPAPLHQKGLQ